ncbi:MAG: ArgE/DapE family deacylase [Patescibacteria group bacterium]|nr:ArgE/DapE family deacylase [Patescibacteria group bacterium]
MINRHDLQSYLRQERTGLIEFLCQLIKFPTTRGHEKEAQDFLYETFHPFAEDTKLIGIPESIISDPDYAFYQEGLTYGNRPNLAVKVPGAGGGKSLIINTHIDVVPAPSDWKAAFNPEVHEGRITGRGACDSKGQITILYALMKTLKEQNIKLKGDLTFHIVIEEEVGGNGALHFVNQKPSADGVIILEPTSLDVHPAVRGAVWFEVRCEGQSGHSGEGKKSISAVKKCIEAMTILERYHDELLTASRGNPYFDSYENPMPITFGIFEGGNWPSTCPQKAFCKGILGFLPNKNKREVQEEMRAAILNYGDEWLKEHFQIRFPMLNNDGFSLPASNPIVTTFLNASKRNAHQPDVRGMTASCDAWMYAKKLGIPTIVFGAGKLEHAHSIQEQIEINDIILGAAIMTDFVRLWCGE